MPDPVQKAKCVLQSKHVGDIPALELKSIADSENVKYLLKPYPGNWDGALAFDGDKRAILVNTTIDNAARHKFTFAHELGHYFLDHKPNYAQDGRLSIRCAISETDTEQKGREREANRFAAELLMPEDDFRFYMSGAPIDFELIKGLSDRYMVSKKACSYRFVELMSKPCVIVFSKNGAVSDVAISRAARGFWGGHKSVPNDTVAHRCVVDRRQQGDFVECDSDKWLARTIPNHKLYECTRGRYKDNMAMTILKW